MVKNFLYIFNVFLLFCFYVSNDTKLQFKKRLSLTLMELQKNFSKLNLFYKFHFFFKDKTSFCLWNKNELKTFGPVKAEKLFNAMCKLCFKCNVKLFYIMCNLCFKFSLNFFFLLPWCYLWIRNFLIVFTYIVSYLKKKLIR